MLLPLPSKSGAVHRLVLGAAPWSGRAAASGLLTGSSDSSSDRSSLSWRASPLLSSPKLAAVLHRFQALPTRAALQEPLSRKPSSSSELSGEQVLLLSSAPPREKRSDRKAPARSAIVYRTKQNRYPGHRGHDEPFQFQQLPPTDRGGGARRLSHRGAGPRHHRGELCNPLEVAEGRPFSASAKARPQPCGIPPKRGRGVDRIASPGSR